MAGFLSQLLIKPKAELTLWFHNDMMLSLNVLAWKTLLLFFGRSEPQNI